MKDNLFQKPAPAIRGNPNFRTSQLEARDTRLPDPEHPLHRNRYRVLRDVTTNLDPASPRAPRDWLARYPVGLLEARKPAAPGSVLRLQDRRARHHRSHA